MRLARRRFGHDEVIDFLAVLFGYAISGERTLEAFYEQLLPLAQPFMALFDRERLPSRSALSRFLASLTWEATEALRTIQFKEEERGKHLQMRILSDILGLETPPKSQKGLSDAVETTANGTG